MQVKSNEVVNIIRHFHPEWGSNFLEVLEKDVENTSFYECHSVNRRTSDYPSTSIKLAYLTKFAVIPFSEAPANDEQTEDFTDVSHSPELSVPFEGNTPIMQDDPICRFR